MFYNKCISFYGLLFLLSGCAVSCRQKVNKVADENKITQIPTTFLSIDKSPMDVSYFPEDYPKEKMLSSNTDNLVARVIYSRPRKNGRVIFADSQITKNFIQHYGQEWRLGANEATEIEFFKNVIINGKNLSRGRYIMYCIPYPDKWKIIFNNNLYSWGLHMDKTKDIFKTDVATVSQFPTIEDFTMVFEPATYGADLLMTWDNVKVILPISFVK